MIRHKLRVTIFLIENEGYTIERFIHGMDADYNDIAGWKYKEIPRAVGARDGDVTVHDVRTKQELEVLLLNREFSEASNVQVRDVLGVFSSFETARERRKGQEGRVVVLTCWLQFVEMHMLKDDAPNSLKLVGTGAAKNNSQKE